MSNTITIAEIIDSACAARCTGWGFGDRKVFLAGVAQDLQCDHPDMTLAQIMQAIVASSIECSRADLVAAMDPAMVAESEVCVGVAVFHFVVVA